MSSYQTQQSTPTTIDAMCDRLLELAEQYYRTPADAEGDREITREHYNLRDALRALRAVAGDQPPGAIDADVLCACQDWMLAQRTSKGKPWARSTINDRINRIRRMIRWARKPPRRWVSAGQVADLDLVEPLKYGRSQARETGDVQPVDHERVTDVMSVCGPQLYAMLDLHWNTGMRPGELVRMRRDEISIERPRLASGGRGEVMVYRPSHHKVRHHGLDRNVFLGPESQRIVEDWLRKIDPAQERLFGYTTNSYREAIVRLIRQHGFGHWTPAQIRHSFAYRMRDTAGIDVTQVLMGHRHRSTTEIYAAPDAASAIEAIMRFG
jgi:integrase